MTSQPAAISELHAAVQRAAATVLDPEIRKPLTELGMIPELTVSPAGVVTATLELTISGCPAATHIETALREALAAVPGVTHVELTVRVMTPERRAAFIAQLRGTKKQQFGADSLTRVLAVTSGKGGVGKSTLTVNLAAALSGLGYRVGILDADVFGFSIPGLLGLVKDGKTVIPTRVGDMILPPLAFNIKAISIGMFLGEKDQRTTAVSWRGPMLHRTIEQFLTDVHYGDLDFLLLDLPPGTGDIAISIGQLLPQAEVLVVTTPQQQAADVAIRSGILAAQTGQKLLGVVENMAGMLLPDGSVTEIFGSGGGAEVAATLTAHTGQNVPLLASLPLSPVFNTAATAATPAVLNAPQDPVVEQLQQLAVSIATRPESLAGKQLPLQFA